MEPGTQTVAIPLVLSILETEVDSETTNTATPEDALISKLEAARDRLENRLNPTVRVTLSGPQIPEHPAITKPEDKMKKLAQKMRDIVEDDDVDDLSEDERERVEELREKYHFWDSIHPASIISPTPDHPALFVDKTPDGSAETIAAAVFDPLEPLDPTMVVNGDEVTPFTETALAEAVATATPPPTL